MSLTSFVIKTAAPVPHPETFSRFLFVGPHPDDIEIGAGATAARLAAEGKDVCFLICTDGRYGTDNLKVSVSPEELASVRRGEAKAAASLLGVRDVRFLNLSDGGFYECGELLSGIARVIGEFKPDAVFCPDPCVTSECHPDHLNTGNAVRRVCCVSSNPGIMAQYGAASASVSALAYYMTAKPNRYVKTGRFFREQIKAVTECFPSQIPSDCADAKSIPLYLKIRSAAFGARKFCAHAEGFRVLGRTQMHCLPEAGR